MLNNVVLRLFNGRLDDARDILAVDRATFNDCPYSPQQIVHLLTSGEQRAWVAVVDGSVVGFVTTFSTHTLRVKSWEVDLLAVQPQYQRQGIGTALIRHAVAGAAGSEATQARAVVAVRNHASRRTFEAAGFRALSDTRHLMLCDVAGAANRPPVRGMEAVRRLDSEADARGVVQLAPALPRVATEVTRLANAGATTLLVAERDGSVSAFVELVQVQTLLYAGAWVEMLITSHRGEASLLIAAAVERVKAEGLDEIGSLIATSDWRLRHAFVSEGFASAGEYLVMIQALP